MANKFDTANYPDREPKKLQAGDRWAWKRKDLSSDYATGSYALTYTARREETGEKISLTASETNSEYVIEIASTTTTNYTAGNYRWTAYITRSSDSERTEVDYGFWEVLENRATSSKDPRTFAQIALNNIETYLKDPTNLSASNYSIAGRSLSRWNRADLIKERSTMQAEVNRERQAEKIAKGLGTNATIRVRFTL